MSELLRVATEVATEHFPAFTLGVAVGVWLGVIPGQLYRRSAVRVYADTYRVFAQWQVASAAAEARVKAIVERGGGEPCETD